MHRLYRRPRRKVLVISIIGALVLAGAAVAAFILYSGTNGSANGNFTSNQTTQAALTISNGGSVPDLQGPGDSEQMPVLITNNNPNATEAATAVTATFTSTPSECASHLSYASIAGHGINGDSIPAGGSDTQPVLISADATLPMTCRTGSYTVTFTGGSTP